jgi:hypothetical protein
MFPEICSELRKAPAVLSVGDLHIASFGTWRDGFGRLIWGILRYKVFLSKRKDMGAVSR